MPGASVRRLREWANALPSVREKRHPRFELPVWQVRGKTFLELGPDRAVATFRIPEESAAVAAAAHPEYARVVHRPNALRTYLGLEVRLPGASGARIKLWVIEAWVAKAPPRLVRRYLDEGGRPPRPLRIRSDTLRGYESKRSPSGDQTQAPTVSRDQQAHQRGSWAS